jgi:hypothetical protein
VVAVVVVVVDVAVAVVAEPEYQPKNMRLILRLVIA